VPDFLDRDEERALIARIDATDPTPFKFQGWTGKRLTTSFGWSYDFEVGRPVAAEPLPYWLLSIRDRAARFAQLDSTFLVQALLIRYDPGAGIGWHRDRPANEDVIAYRSASQRRCASDVGAKVASSGLMPRSIPAPLTI
jgi:alkylated DNA repair protein (DNA oxidative demethylase)